MSKNRQSADSRFVSFFQWFEELPPQIKVVVVGVLVVGIILAILPPSLFHSFNCEVQNLPQSYRSSNGYFIDNQVIVVGPREDVEAVIGSPSAETLTPTPPSPTVTGTPPTTVGTLLALPATTGTPTGPGTPSPFDTPVATPTAIDSEPEKVILNLIEGCDLSYLNTRKDLKTNSPVEERQLVMRLYEIPDANIRVEDVITDIDVVAREKQADISVDPNYLTRLADFTSDPCARPADSGGTGGGPFGDPGIADPEKARDAFLIQWAFEGQGVNLPASTTLTGRRVRVGVFDTSPYRINLPFFKWIATGLPSPLWFTNWDAGGTTMMSNHGLFVAELIHGIAPKSRIQLIRVLNEDGCGELWALNKGLEDYKSRMSAWTGKMDKTVINMSLGIRVADAEEDNDTGSEQDTPGSPENDSGPEEESNDRTLEVNDEENEDLETLKGLIDISEDMGAIIVASAGNDSPGKDKDGNTVDAMPMQIPASYDNVIGVAATDEDGKKTCYSNKGDVAAPGGKGGVAEIKSGSTTRTIPCASRASTWNTGSNPCPGRTVTDIANCQYVLISLGQTRYGPQYMLWSGTSFAAPLVSGLVALAYEDAEQDQIDCMIREGGAVKQAGRATPDPVMGWGLIDVNESLSPAMIAKCPVLP